MADKSSNGGSGPSDLDPFAELAKIMGFDPRQPVRSVASAGPSVEQSAAAQDLGPEDFGIDLEREMLGDLAANEPPVAETSAAIDSPPVVEAAADETAFDLDFDEIENEISQHVDAFLAAGEPKAEPAETVALVSPAAPAATVEAVAIFPDEIHMPNAFDASPAINAPREMDAPDAIDSIEAAFEDIFAAEDSAPLAAASAEDGDEPTHQDGQFVADAPAPEDAPSAREAMADADLDFDLDTIAAAADAPTLSDPEIARLEAEYNALLGNTSIAARPEAEAVQPSVSEQVDRRTAAIVAGAWGSRPAELAQSPEPLRAEPDNAEASGDLVFDMFADTDWTESTTGEEPQTQMLLVAEQHGVDDLGIEDVLTEDDMAALDEIDLTEAIAEPTPVAAQPAPRPTPEDPFAALAAMAAQYQSGNFASIRREASVEPAHRAPAQMPRAAVPPTRPAAPEIETVHVDENAVFLADDLDIPEIAFEEPQAEQFADIEAEFDNLLSEMSAAEPRVTVAPAAPAAARPVYSAATHHPAYVEKRPPYQAPSVPARAVAPPADLYAGELADDARYATSDTSFEAAMASFELEDDDEIGYGAPLPPMRKSRPRRAFYVAAVVGGLALIGGISAVAISFGSNGDAEVALVKADTDPFKVRPAAPTIEATAPTEASSPVYNTVSRSAAQDAPTQERLVTTAEEPMALPIPDDAELGAQVDEIAELAKAEDRVEPQPEDDLAQNQDTIAVAPRRVRTMLVRADGTLVPREEPSPEITNSTADQPAPQAEAQPEITTGATATAAVQPEEPQQVAAVQPAEQPAIEPEQPKPVVAGAWSVQVSSQPSEDGANKSLKDISRRYASVIGERGANVVKAEVSGKGTMWRVRIPTGSREDAVNLCGNLKAAGGSCFVTK